MKKCIWCLENESEVFFDKQAHTIPKSIGGRFMCENVCDECNRYFGNHSDNTVPIETAVKELFLITRYFLSVVSGEFGKNKAMVKFNSIYFDKKGNKFETKLRYQLTKNFQSNLTRQLIRGIYKIYLEELERCKKISHDDKFDFIRDFSRFNEGELPLLYYTRRHGILLTIPDFVKNPQLYFEDEHRHSYLFENDFFFEFELYGHVFGIATNKDWKSNLEDYYKNSFQIKVDHFKQCALVNHFSDIDFSLETFFRS